MVRSRKIVDLWLWRIIRVRGDGMGSGGRKSSYDIIGAPARLAGSWPASTCLLTSSAPVIVLEPCSCVECRVLLEGSSHDFGIRRTKATWLINWQQGFAIRSSSYWLQPGNMFRTYEHLEQHPFKQCGGSRTSENVSTFAHRSIRSTSHLNFTCIAATSGARNSIRLKMFQSSNFGVQWSWVTGDSWSILPVNSIYWLTSLRGQDSFVIGMPILYKSGKENCIGLPHRGKVAMRSPYNMDAGRRFFIGA